MTTEQNDNTPEIIFCIFNGSVERLNKTLDYTLDSLKKEIQSTKNIYKIWGLCANLVAELSFVHSLTILLEKVLKQSLEYDFYDEICNITENLESKLLMLKKVCFSEKEAEIQDYCFTNYFDGAIGQAYLKKMKEACGEKEVDGFLNFTENNVRFQILALPALLEVLIDSLKELRTFQFDRPNKDLLEIFLYRKEEYEKNEFPEQWKQYKGMLRRIRFAFDPMDSEGLKEVFQELAKTLTSLKLGEVYLYDYDSEEIRAYEYNRLRCRHEEWELFFKTVLKYEYLKKLIDETKEAENSSNKTRFPPHIEYQMGVTLMNFLKDEGFIAKDTDSDSFMYLMGCSNEKPKELKKIVFLQSKQILRELLEKAFLVLLDTKSFRKADIERIAPKVFVNLKGECITLAKNKLTPSAYSDKIFDFFSNNKRHK